MEVVATSFCVHRNHDSSLPLGARPIGRIPCFVHAASPTAALLLYAYPRYLGPKNSALQTPESANRDNGGLRRSNDLQRVAGLG
jgi:hypothetical protein